MNARATLVLAAGALILSTIALLGATAPLSGEASHSIEDRGKPIVIESALGEIEIGPSPTARIEARVDIEAWMPRPEGDPSARIVVSDRPDALVIGPSYGMAAPDGGTRAGRVVVLVPSGAAPVRVVAKVGRVTASGATRPLVIDSSAGSVHVSQWKGDIAVQSRFGGVAIQDAEGAVSIDVEMGDVRITRIRSAAVRVAYGDVHAEQIDAELQIAIGMGNARARDVGGRTRVAISLGSAVVEESSSAIEVRTDRGDIDLAGLRADALRSRHELSAREGNIRVQWPQGAPVRTTIQAARATGLAEDGTPNESASGAEIVADAPSGAFTLLRESKRGY